MEDPFSNNDIMVEVLSRLSTKDLCASKCVSKRWNSVISNPSFLRMHYNSQRSTEISGLFIPDLFSREVDYLIDSTSVLARTSCRTYFSSKTKKKLDFLPERVNLMASCNGLLCCRSYIYPWEYDCPPSKELVIYVCNPTTKEWIAILRPIGCHFGNSVGLAFYPFGSSSNSAPSFKLVSIQRPNNDPNTYSFVVYSSETRRWTTSKQVCHCNYEINDKNREIFIGQRFHWLTMNHYIITFDVEREVSGVIKLPGPMIEEERTCLGGCEGYLHYVCVHSTEFKVWMLKDYFKPEWVLKYHLTMFDFCEEDSAKLSGYALLVALAFYEDVLFMYLDGWFYSYNFKTRILEKHCPSFIGPTVLPYSVCLAAGGVLEEYRREGSKHKSNGDLIK